MLSFGRQSSVATSSATALPSAALTQMGWTPITIWECELKKDRIDATMEKVIEQVRAAEPQR